MHRSDLRLSSHGLLSSLVTSLLPKDASRVGLIQYDLFFTKHATTPLPLLEEPCNYKGPTQIIWDNLLLFKVSE